MAAAGSSTATKPPGDDHQGEGAAMLQRLIAEAANKPVAFSDDLSVQTRGQQLRGLAACHQDDVLHKNWLSAFMMKFLMVFRNAMNFGLVLKTILFL